MDMIGHYREAVELINLLIAKKQRFEDDRGYPRVFQPVRATTIGIQRLVETTELSLLLQGKRCFPVMHL